MTDALRAKIALDGADQVKKQLADLGTTGQQAFRQIGDATQAASQNLNSAQSVVGQLVSAFQSAVQDIAGAGKALGHAFDPLISAAHVAADAIAAVAKTGGGFGAIAGAAVGISAAIGKIGQDAANSVAKLNDAAKAAGLTAEKYSALKAALNGIGVKGDVLDRIVEAADKAARAAEVNAPPSRVRKAPQSGASGDDANDQEDDAAQGAGAAAGSVGKLGESVLGAERAISDLPTVWKHVDGQLQQIHPEFGPEVKGLTGFAQAAQELGVSLRDMYGKAKPGIDVARDMVLALSKMEDGARRSDIAARAFGEGLAKDVLDIADNNDAISALAKAHERAAANMSEAQKKQADEARRTGAVLESVKASWLQYFQSLATPVTIDQNNAIISFLERNKQAIKDFGDNVVGPAIRWLGQFQNAFGATAIAAAGLGSALGLLSPLTASIFGAAGVAAIAFGDDIKNGALAAMTGLTDIVKANDLTTFAGWKNAAIAVWEDIKQIALDAWTSISQRIAAVDWASVWSNLKSSALAAFVQVVALATAEWARIAEVFADVDLSGLWDAFVARASEAFARIANLAREGYIALRTAALSTFPGLTAAWREMERVARAVFNSMKEMSAGTWLAIGLGLLGVVGLFSGTFGEILLLAAPFWRQILAGAEALFPGLRAALGPLASVVSETFAGIETLAAAAWAYLRALLTGDKVLQTEAWDALAESASAAWAQITEAFATGYAAIRAQLGASFAWLREPWEEMKGVVISAWEGMEGAVTRAWAAIKAEHEAGWPTIMGIWDNLVATWKGVVAAADTVAGAINLIFRTNYSGKQLLLISVLLQVIGLAPLMIEMLALVVVGIELFSAALTAIRAAPAIAAIGALIVAVDQLYNHWSELTGPARAFYAALAVISVGVIAYVAAFRVVPTVAAAVVTAINGITVAARGFVAMGAAAAAVNPEILLIVAAVLAVAAALYALYKYWDETKARAQWAWEGIKQGASNALDAVRGTAEAFFSWLDAKWNALKDLGGSLWDKFKDGATSAWDAVKTAFTDSIAWIEAKWDALISKIKAGLAAIGLGSSSSSAPSPSSAPANDNSAPSDPSAAGFASGGLISGPGTGTSDSILARVSNGEHITPAQATSFWGGNVMEAIRSADLHGLLGALQLPGFALGGLVGVPAPVAIPAFASGGHVSRPAHAGLIPFTLDLGGKQHEVYADRDAMSDLQRHSALRQMSATTKRSPGWNR